LETGAGIGGELRIGGPGSPAVFPAGLNETVAVDASGKVAREDRV
jgi:hypothetical protein